MCLKRINRLEKQAAAVILAASIACTSGGFALAAQDAAKEGGQKLEAAQDTRDSAQEMLEGEPEAEEAAVSGGQSGTAADGLGDGSDSAQESAAETGDILRIANEEDFLSFARQCALDSWSVGKTVVLDNDLNLEGKKFSPVPVFGGTFDGQGRRIRGFSMEGEGKNQGLFRYISEGGTVKNLTVEGMCLGEEGSVFGGIAGRNRGTIVNCEFRGQMKGKDSVGGIVGINELTGQIVTSRFFGQLSGQHYVGGIAGQNFGVIRDSMNDGGINTADTRVSSSLESLNLERLNDTENLPAFTDVGGITGFSTGILLNCRNTGTVGYERVGYNIGGIAGRQSGYLGDCENAGKVLGRKDVGGIAGQLEPAVLVKYEEDTLNKLKTELDVLKSVADQAVDNSDRISDSLDARLRSISDSTDAVRNAAEELSDSASDWADDGIGQINELSSRITWAMDQMVPVMRGAEDSVWMVQDAGERLFDMAEELEAMAETGAESIDGFHDAVQEIENAVSHCKEAQKKLKEAGETFRRELEELLKNGRDEEAEWAPETVEKLKENAKALQDALDALRNAAEECRKAVKRLGDLEGYGNEAMKDAKDGASVLDTALDELIDTLSDGTDILKELAEKPAIEFQSIESSVSEKGDQLSDTLSSLSDEMNALTDLMRDSSDTAFGDIRSIGDQFEAVVDVLQNGVEEEKEKNPEDRFEDLSEQEDSQDVPEAGDSGRILGVVNRGGVEGDVNVGGIAGSMAVEYDFDPEDDLVKIGEKSLNFRYQTLAVIDSCENRGAVTARKNYAGGIAGRMDLGRISSCESVGDIESRDGSYVGGIAGFSDSLIRDCWTKGILKGKDFIGGTAGLGSTIRNCHAMVEIPEGGARTGAIAGDMEDSGVLLDNTFSETETVRAAVDGVSYSGKAFPVTFEELCATPGAPADIERFSVKFLADGELVKEIFFQYGGGIDTLPEIPQKAGYTAAWPDMEYKNLYANRVAEARYMPSISSLASEDQDGFGRPLILAEGTFESGDLLRCQSSEASWSDPSGKRHEGTAYTVSLGREDGTEAGLNRQAESASSMRIHYRPEDKEKKISLWVQDPQTGWQKADYQWDGSYLVFDSLGKETTFCVLEKEGWLKKLFGWIM